MNEAWLKRLAVDPIPVMLGYDDPALTHFVDKDLLGKDMGSDVVLQNLPESVKLVNSQEENGSWRYPGENSRRDPTYR